MAQITIQGQFGHHVTITVENYERDEAETVEDANWLGCHVNAEAGSFKGAVISSIMTYDLISFSEQINAIITGKTDSAEFKPFDETLVINVISTKLGNVVMNCSLKESMGNKASLSIMIESNLSDLSNVYRQISNVLKVFPEKNK